MKKEYTYKGKTFTIAADLCAIRPLGGSDSIEVRFRVNDHGYQCERKVSVSRINDGSSIMEEGIRKFVDKTNNEFERKLIALGYE